MKNAFLAILVEAVCFTVTNVYADIPTLSIYKIQYVDVNEHPDGNSPEEGKIVNCTGGIVIHRYLGSRHKLVLYDPNNWDGWGGISVKGDNDTNPMPFDSNEVQLGVWIYLENVFVNEIGKSRGNTDLLFKNDSFYFPLSTGNALPKPLVVDVNDVAVVYNPDDDTCYVTDHRAEIYEGMYIQVRNVTVGDVNVGKADPPDNYSLESDEDPNIYCWASDYMNIDNPDDETPHPIIETGLFMCGLNGIFEQYTKESEGWDYYQILTTNIGDFVIEQKGDLDGDCDVDFDDLATLSDNWLVGTN